MFGEVRGLLRNDRILYKHELVVTDVSADLMKQLPTVRAEHRIPSSVGGELFFRIEARIGLHVDLIALGLVRHVGEEAAVGEKLGSVSLNSVPRIVVPLSLAVELENPHIVSA